MSDSLNNLGSIWYHSKPSLGLFLPCLTARQLQSDMHQFESDDPVSRKNSSLNYIQLNGHFSLENISPQCALICIKSNNAEKVIKLLYYLRDLRNHDTVQQEFKNHSKCSSEFQNFGIGIPFYISERLLVSIQKQPTLITWQIEKNVFCYTYTSRGSTKAVEGLGTI